MANTAIELSLKGGFSFDLCRRNEMLANKGVQPPSFRKTGTTIVGLVFKVSSTVTARLLIFNCPCCLFISYFRHLKFPGNLLNNYIRFILHFKNAPEGDRSARSWK